MKNLTINPNISIHQAMKALDKTAEKCLLIVDEYDKLLGTLTDGDLRRGMLSGLNFTAEILERYNTDATTFIQGNYTQEDAKPVLRDRK